MSIITIPAVECLVLLALSVYLVSGFADHKRTPISLLVTTVIGWFLCFSPIIATPLDMFLAQGQDENTELEDQALGFLVYWWYVLYLSGSFLGFFVIPLQQGYVMAGEFSTIERCQSSLKNNVPWFIMYFFGFVIMLLIVHYCGKDENGHSELEEKGLLSVAVSLNLAFGFILLMLFLGYGLIRIPVALWQFSNLNVA